VTYLQNLDNVKWKKLLQCDQQCKAMLLPTKKCAENSTVTGLGGEKHAERGNRVATYEDLFIILDETLLKLADSRDAKIA
jgi:hypothetical protein